MVSVVIPTHNRSDLLPRAIKSVQEQIYSDLEIIVVSDGSTDDTKAVVEGISKKDSRVRFIEYHPARGGNIARNTGIEAAQGEYVAFLDDDDEWLPEKLTKQVAVMESDSKIGLVYTGVHIIYVNEKISYASKSCEAGEMSKKILFDNYIGTTSTVMLKKSLISQTGMFDENLRALQDYDLWIRFCQHCKVGVVAEELINYYNYTNSKQISALTQKYIDSFEYINSKYHDLYETLTPEEIKAKKNNEYTLLINKAMRNGNGKLARQYAKALRKNGNLKKALVFYCLSFLKYKTVLKIRSKV